MGKEFSCSKDEGCQDLLTGTACCIDIMGATKFESPQANWNKKCCSNDKAPYTVIPRNISDEDKTKIDNQIGRMVNLKQSICKAMEYDQMLEYPTCNDFKTTTTTTTTTTTKKPETTQPPTTQPVSQGSPCNQAAAVLTLTLSLLPYWLLHN